MGCRLSQLQVQVCPDLVDMLEHRGSPSVSIPCSSFHHRSAMRAAEATTMVLLWAKILIVQLDLTNDRIIPLFIHRGAGSCPGRCGPMPAAMEGFLQSNLSLLTGAVSGAAPLAQGQAQGSIITAPGSRHGSAPAPGTRH